jgi:hypothetical protein
MKLFALPEDVINNVFTALQSLPFNQVNDLLAKVQNAKLVVDANKNPVEVPDAPETNQQAPQLPPDITPVQ